MEMLLCVLPKVGSYQPISKVEQKVTLEEFNGPKDLLTQDKWLKLSWLSNYLRVNQLEP